MPYMLITDVRLQPFNNTVTDAGEQTTSRRSSLTSGLKKKKFSAPIAQNAGWPRITSRRVEHDKLLIILPGNKPGFLVVQATVYSIWLTQLSSASVSQYTVIPRLTSDPANEFFG